MPTTRTYIDQISIQNFKFFPKLENPIEVDGKHLLIYGENGSGKSSIYWALYTLLECANKDDDTEIKKYFDPTDDERLTNIHITQGSPNWVEPFIQVTLKDGSAPFYVSYADTSINQNKEAQESDFSSDFINYRSLLSLSNFAHSEDINLFSFFLYAILPYVKFAPVTYWHKQKDGRIIQFTTDSANGIWNFVFNGPQKNIPNKQGHPRFPQGIEQEIIDYRNLVTGFKSGLQDLITFINTEGNPILKIDLGYSLTFKLELIEHPVYKGSRKRRDPFLLTQQKFEAPKYTIKFDITEYEGVPNAVKRPHSFLNEARLTAVGLAIRLAVLKRTTSEDAKLKLLALDDLLISLDMSNREKVLEMIFKKYQADYQCLIFTHDKNFFDLIKRIIDQNKYPNWCCLEMFSDEDSQRPVILSSETYYARACYYLKSFDYPASANYFRKACEDMFETLFPTEVPIGESGDRRTTLKNYIDAAMKLYDRIGYSTANLKLLDNYLFLLLNPLSHRAIDTNIYKVELNRVKALIPLLTREIKDLNLREIIAANSVLVVVCYNDATTINEYFIKTAEPIYVYNNTGHDDLTNSRCRSFESITINNGVPQAAVKNERYDENNIIGVHKKIFERWDIPYDNSFMINIYHQAHITNARTRLDHIKLRSIT